MVFREITVGPISGAVQGLSCRPAAIRQLVTVPLRNDYLRRMAQKNAGAKVVVENVNHPGKTSKVEKIKYDAMKKAMLQALPTEPPGFTQDEIRKAVLPFLSKEVFPGGEKVGWWAKSVQLDLEAKRIVVRDTAAKPLRWTRA
jgi:hypothetical protein